MIKNIGRKCNLFNVDTLGKSPDVIIAYNCLYNYRNSQIEPMLDFLKGDKDLLKDFKNLIDLFGKYPRRISFKLSGKKRGRIFVICKPFFQNVLIEKIGEFERTNQVYYKDQVDFVKTEIVNFDLSIEKNYFVDFSSFLSFDQKEQRELENFFANLPQRFELYY